MSLPARPTTRAYWATGPFRGEIREVALSARGPADVLVRTLYSGISRGTEALVAAGRVPESEWGRMRCPFQDGLFPFPVKYGYSAVGLVEAGPPALAGRKVFCLYPHQTAFVVPATAVTALPSAVPPGRAVLAANLETALNAVWDAGPLPGDRVTVVGAGVVGALIARLVAGIPGTEVCLVDRDGGRADLARALGVSFALPDRAQGEADIVVEASGTPDALARCLELAGFEATVLVVGWYGTAEVPLPLGQSFHSRRLRLVASQVGAVAARQRNRWTPARRMAKVMDLLADPVLDALITAESSFDELPSVLPRLALEPEGTLCHRIRYD